MIIGAGIGGLTIALSLHGAGFHGQVYEAAKEIKASGVGINLLPHAVPVLANLGLQKPLEEIAVPTSELVYFYKFSELFREYLFFHTHAILGKVLRLNLRPILGGIA